MNRGALVNKLYKFTELSFTCPRTDLTDHLAILEPQNLPVIKLGVVLKC